MTWFQNWKVGTKLVAGFVMVSALAVLVGGIGSRKIHLVDDEDTKLYEKITVPLGELAEMSVAFQRVRISLRDAVEAHDPGEVAGFKNEIAKYRELMTQKGALVEKTLLTAEGRGLYREFLAARKVYGAIIERIYLLDGADQNREAVALLRGEGKAAATHEQDLLDRLIQAKVQQGRLTSENNSRVANDASRFMIVLSLFGMGLAAALGLIISKMITRPLSQAVSAAQRLAAGDLTVAITVTGRDETGLLLAAMRDMVANLRELIVQTVAVSGGVAAGATQLHATAEQIATSAEEVASQTDTVATASEEMAATSSDIARNCLAAAEASDQSTASATSGARVIRETIDSMVRITQRVRQTARTVESLGSSSEKIGDIVGTIEDIADQTNLLALNAAIEAARAGEQGRGFAVVADEVRALADRTTRATKEIGAMIKTIQLETNGAVRSMEEGVLEAEEGALSAQRSGEAMKEIQGRISEVTMQVSQIATAAEQQTATTGEVTSNIQQITEVVQLSARGAEETASGAALLAQQAVDLQELVRHFKIA